MRFAGIFFDLDGTLLPMDNDPFIRGYLKLLSSRAAQWGYEPRRLIDAMWQGVEAMVKNQGPRSNGQCFWDSFAGVFGPRVYEDIGRFDAFYSQDYHQARALTRPTPLARQALDLARQKAEHVVLATNPIFPEVAVRSRLSWAELAPEDFDLVTCYSNSCSCKPNPDYYRQICRRLDLAPERCLMIGNNAQEDAEAAAEAGLQTYLLTDWLINEKPGLPDCPRGSFPELIDWLRAL